MSCNCCQCCDKESDEHEDKKEKIINTSLFIFGLVCLIIAFVLQKVDKSGFNEISWSYFSNKDFYKSYSFIAFILYTVGYVPLLIKTIKSCIEEIKEGEIFNEFLLMVIATIGAYVINEFPESLFVLLFSIIGELLENYATDKSKKSIKALINSMPLYAHFINQDGSIIEKEPEELVIGDLIEIRPGEKVCVDGKIIKGSSSFDFSSLNGESLPKDLKENDEVYSGSINLSSVIVLQVSKEYKNSTLSKIMQLVEGEEEKKAKAEKFITKFASIYTPIVMLIAVVIFLIGFAVSGWSYSNGGREWLYKALSILLISCPCSLVISVPVAFFASIGSASKYGILIKGSVSLEALAKSDTAVFDKTGTLTKGEFVLNNTPSVESLKLASSLESKSTHPLANAITKNYNGELYEVLNLLNVPGKGIQGEINNKMYYIGSLEYVNEINNSIAKIETPFKVLYLATKEDGLIDVFIVKDEVKEEAKDALQELKNENIKETIILSGDDKDIVLQMKDEIHTDKALYELMPEEKLNEIGKLQNNKHKVLYVGDGINDSPSILKSDVGIAMGGLGSDAAIEASDIVILDDNLHKVSEAKHLSKKAISTVIISIALSLVLKAIIMVLVASGVLQNFEMIISSIADTGILIICLLNSIRMLFYKPKYLKQNK